jgi:hypothetical protein
MTPMTWFELSTLANGTRVEFVTDWDIFPETLVPAGARATVTQNDLNEITMQILVLPDDVRIQRALEAWDGEIILSPTLPTCMDDPVWEEASPLAICVS